jgi:hypothetical protein
MAVFATAPKKTSAIVNSRTNFIEYFFISGMYTTRGKRLVKKNFIYLPIKMPPPFGGKPRASSLSPLRLFLKIAEDSSF